MPALTMDSGESSAVLRAVRLATETCTPSASVNHDLRLGIEKICIPERNGNVMENLNSEKLISTRKVTRAIARLECAKAQEDLGALAPLMSPARLLGELVGGGTKGASPTIAKTAAELAGIVRQVAGAKPFSVDLELKPPLEVDSTTLELNPYQYRYTAVVGESRRAVTIVSPLNLLVSYSGYTLCGLRSLLAQRDASRESVQRFLIRTVLLNVVMTRPAGLIKILEGLRYQITTTTLPEFGSLPLTCISWGLRTVRPSDEAILEMTEYSGIDQVEETLEAEALSNFPDPLRELILGAVNGSAGCARAVA
jgi:hypothetical protein